jgi:hypothetical protein
MVAQAHEDGGAKGKRAHDKDRCHTQSDEKQQHLQ